MVRTSTNTSCPCGRPFVLIETIEGRKAEVLNFPSPTGSKEEVSPYLFEIVFDTMPVNGWQVVQEHDGLHIFLIGAKEELRDEHLLDALWQMLTKRGVIIPFIKIHRVGRAALRGGVVEGGELKKMMRNELKLSGPHHVMLLCASRDAVFVSPTQLGRIWRNILGSSRLPEVERQRGQEHA